MTSWGWITEKTSGGSFVAALVFFRDDGARSPSSCCLRHWSAGCQEVTGIRFILSSLIVGSSS
ncbi:MAG: hypothetical protein ACLUQ6_11910 [Alistipes onderdonkii]